MWEKGVEKARGTACWQVTKYGPEYVPGVEMVGMCVGGWEGSLCAEPHPFLGAAVTLRTPEGLQTSGLRHPEAHALLPKSRKDCALSLKACPLDLNRAMLLQTKVKGGRSADPHPAPRPRPAPGPAQPCKHVTGTQVPHLGQLCT